MWQRCEYERFTIPKYILSKITCIQHLVSVSLFVLKILKKNLILISNKGTDSVANLWRMTIYNLNVDLVYDNVHTKIGLNKSIRSQDIKNTDF